LWDTFCLVLAICTLIAAAAVPGDDEELWNLPVVERSTIPQPNSDGPDNRELQRWIRCRRSTDAEAVRFETRGAVPIPTGLLPEMAQALEKFRKLVTSAGGTFDLKSAYRPLAYQEHLQQVWFKWMRELRFNHQPGCQALRAQVAEEFTRHKLMPTQMPVTDSDHTRGMAIDAAVMMPHIVPYEVAKKRPSLR
jgi:hypothetical protein